jgi:hypothetical protein
MTNAVVFHYCRFFFMIPGYAWHLIIFKEFYEGLGIYNSAEPIIPPDLHL